MQESKLINQTRNIKLILTILVILILAGGGLFVAYSLTKENNIAEEKSSASNATEKVKYMPGEIIIGFSSIPDQATDAKLREISQLDDLKLTRRLNETTYLYSSITLRDNALVGINSGNLVNGNWGDLDRGTNQTLTLLNENSKTELPNFNYAEPNYTVEAFGN